MRVGLSRFAILTFFVIPFAHATDAAVVPAPAAPTALPAAATPPAPAAADVCVKALDKPKVKRDRRSLPLSPTFEADTRQAFDAYEQKIETNEAGRIVALRNQLADIENNNPQGFNIFVLNERNGMSWLVRSMLRLGQERKVKMLIGQLVYDERQLFNDLQAQTDLREEAIQDFFAADLSVTPGIGKIVQTISENRVAIRRQLADKIWLYSGVVGTLLQEAGLQAPSGLLSDGIERQLENDLVHAFVRDPVPAVVDANATAQGAQTPEDVSRQTALRVLQILRVVDDSKKEIAPTMFDFEKLLAGSTVVRAAKLESEISYERREQRNQWLLSFFSDQYILSLATVGLNAATLGKFKDNFEQIRAELEQSANRTIARGRILEFINLANVLKDDATGNAQLAESLRVLLGSDPALLRQMSITVQCIEPLRRIKGTDFAKNTIWGDKGEKLVDAISDLEGKRGQSLTSVTTTSRRRSHILTAAVTTLITYAGTVHGSAIAQAGIQHYDAIKATLLGLLGY